MGTQLNHQHIFFGSYTDRVASKLETWEDTRFSERLWQHDGTLWIPDPEQAAATPELMNRLGWLDLPESMAAEAGELSDFAAEIRAAGMTDVVLLGMGGSSLAPEVLMTIFGNAPGFPALRVLDSTHPDVISVLDNSIDLAKTLFLVSSKSGGTIETLSFYKYFFHRVAGELENPGDHFVAITDPGSKLELMAREQQFRRIFSSPADVGGRYSVLTYFGLLPAALIGIDVAEFLQQAAPMEAATGPGVPVAENPALVLGAVLGALALAGRNKVVFLSTPKLEHFGVWIEQLVAESTGKLGRGILPVVGEPLLTPAAYGKDCCFVSLQLAGDLPPSLGSGIEKLKVAGFPVVIIKIERIMDLAQEFYRWEVATAAAGAVLEINPFNQPNVEAAKIKARELMETCKKTGELPVSTPLIQDDHLSLYGLPQPSHSVKECLQQFLQLVKPGDYLALMAYLPMAQKNDALLQRFRLALRERCRVVTTLGYGPRFLHSTGQLHKGDGNQGVFIQFTADPEQDVTIPGEPYTFGTLIAAQAQGDFQALEENGRRLLRIHLSGSLESGLKYLISLVGTADG
ncbi:MAG: glucose-6-phosphate isomerase [Xanthomonadaceae bacterium]|nr:glucose-6-phosphate isomerase [Xanthomonadaceae bacterium]